MGKGDLKTRRGKLFNGSFGKRRPAKKTKKNNKPVVKQETPVIKAQPKPTVKAETKTKAKTKEKESPKKPQKKPLQKNKLLREKKKNKISFIFSELYPLKKMDFRVILKPTPKSSFRHHLPPKGILGSNYFEEGFSGVRTFLEKSKFYIQKVYSFFILLYKILEFFKIHP